jgi:outer membrane protein assembly factor BamB
MRLGRATLACLLLGAVTAIAASEVPDLRTRKQGVDWPRFLGPGGDGKSPETSLKLAWGKDGPTLRWVKPVGEGYSAPSIARGRLFMFDRHGDRARLTCMNAETGEELWRQEYPTDYEDMYRFSGGPRTTPVVDDDRVYTFGVEGRLRCHNVTDGTLLWEIDTTAQYGVVQNFFGVGSTPIVEDDLLIVPVGGSPKNSPGIQSGRVEGNGSGIVAFDKHSGEERYRVSDELASYSSPVIVDVGRRRYGLAFLRGGLVGFEPRSGKLDFHFPWRATKLESVNASSPVVVGDKVLISESYGPGSALLRVRPGGYEVLRKDPRRGQSLQTHWATPIHHEGTVYGCSGSGSGDAELRAIELKSGKVLWKQPGLGRVTLLLVQGHLIVLGERGRLLVVEATPESYRPVADVMLKHGSDALIEYPAWNAPALSHGLLYLRGKTRLACLDLK